MAEKFTQFDYLLNALELAAQADQPAEHGYGEKRRALYAHVRELERKAAAFDARQTPDGVAAAVPAPIPGESLRQPGIVCGRCGCADLLYEGTKNG